MSVILDIECRQIAYHHKIDDVPDPSAFYMHAHEKYEIYYFISGNGSYVVEGTQYPLAPATVMIMRPGETHKLQIVPDTPYERIGIHFYSSALDGIEDGDVLLRPFNERGLGERNMYSADMLDASFIRDCFRLIERCIKSGSEHAAMLSGLLPILSELSRAFSDNSSVSGKASSQTAQDIIAYINSNLTSPLSLESLAEHFFLSKTQLARVFRKATGSSVWDYIIVKRLLIARQLIRSGENSVIACRKCGFGDYSCFFRAYKKRYGIAPSEDK